MRSILVYSIYPATALAGAIAGYFGNVSGLGEAEKHDTHPVFMAAFCV